MVSYNLEYIGDILKKARLAKGLSQRALSLKIAVPQGHISKIENGMIDIRISSLLELSRALELEPMFVHKSLVPMFEALQDEKRRTNPKQVPLYQLGEQEDDD